MKKQRTRIAMSHPFIRLLGVTIACAALAACDDRPATAATDNPPPAPVAHLGADAWPAAASPLPADPELERRIDELLARMSDEEKVGQVIQAEIRHATPADVRKYHLGSILNGGGAFPNGDKYATVEDWLELADAFHDASVDAADGRVPIPVIWGTDAVHGHGNVIGATLFPHNVGLGAMHNPALMREIGRVTAREVLATGIDWTFAPTVAVAQDDRWGRTYESYGEEPALVRAYAEELTRGLQGVPGAPDFLDANHVLATAKHYLGDGGTLDGDDQGDVRIGEEELRDIHAPGYVGAIEAGVQVVMASFSSWNGVKMHGNRYLLTDVLKQRMGFDGFLIGDWNGHGQVPGCTNASCPGAFNAGLDVFMVVDDWKDLYRNTLAQVRSGEISGARLDDAVRRVLRVKLRAGVFERGRPSARAARLGVTLGSDAHRAVARQAVRESLVLLKNAGGVLPLGPGQRVLVAGDGAHDVGKQSGGWTISWQGTGNERADFPGATSILEGLRAALEAIGGTVEHAPDGTWSQRPDVAVVVYGEDPYAEYQGDRPDLEFEPGAKRSLALLERLRDDGIPVVSVFLSGRPLWVNAELNASDAFVAAWLPGGEGGGVADVLVADAAGQPRHDFSGRLSFSWPRDPAQGRLNPHHPGYDPLFALGYGLDYATAEAGPGRLATDVAGAAGARDGVVALYRGRPLPPWAVFIGSGEGPPMMVSGNYAAHASGAVTARAADMRVQEDALRIEFSGTAPARAFFDGPGLDLRGYRAAGVLAFAIRQDEPAAGGLRLSVGAGSIDLAAQGERFVGEGWVEVSVPLACFAADEAALERVQAPFAIEADGAAAIAFGDIRYVREGAATLACD
jgi:beta-glucosidase